MVFGCRKKSHFRYVIAQLGNHGGLTPAALENLRIGTDDIANARPDERRAPGL